MNPHKTIEKLNLGDTINRLLSILINTDTIDTNLYIGTIDIVPDGEPNLDQLPWIPRKVENLKKLTGELHDTAVGLDRLAQLAKEVDESSQKSFPLTCLYREFRSADFIIQKQIDHLKMVLKDLDNGVYSIKYPKTTHIKNLYKIKEKSSKLIIKEQDRVEYPSRVLTFVGKLMESPMHYYLFSVSEADGTAFISRGYRVAPLVGAGYHEIWGDIHTNPHMVSSECVWRS